MDDKQRLEEMDYIEQAKQLVRNYDKLSQSNNIILTYTGRCAIAKVIEQAERVQELERVNKQLKNNLSVYKGYYNNMIKINKDTVEQNKRYREKIELALDMSNRGSKNDVRVSNMQCVLKEALEESE